MNDNLMNAIIAMTPPPQNGQQSTAPWWMNMVPLVLMVVVFYFILIRPQQKKAKELEELLKNIKSGNKVMTSSGIIGIVVNVKERTVTLRSADTKLEVVKSSITEVLEREETTADDAPPRKNA
ncbi:MAG: preprotein translocase subunit YajC [Verrucomicrobiota bacterium]